MSSDVLAFINILVNMLWQGKLGHNSAKNICSTLLFILIQNVHSHDQSPSCQYVFLLSLFKVNHHKENYLLHGNSATMGERFFSFVFGGGTVSHSHQQCVVSRSFHIPANMYCHLFSGEIVILTSVNGYFCGFNMHFLIIRDIEYFSYIVGHLCVFLW